MTNPLRTYPVLYAHVAKLAGLAMGRRLPYLLVAPATWIALELLSGLVVSALGPLAGGLAMSLLRAAAFSLVLFTGRAIIEQRRLGREGFARGPGAFFGDVLTVFFTLWIVSLVLGPVAPRLIPILYLAVVALPVPEVVALSHMGGYAVLGEAWNFVRRDAPAWLAGHVMLVALVPIWVGLALLLQQIPSHSLPGPLALVVAYAAGSVPALLALIAFVYRGILYLTLDETSARQRAERFGGAPSLR